MGWRFRRSFKIAPGVRINVGKKGASVTFGGRGAHYTVHSSGRALDTLTARMDADGIRVEELE